IGFPVLENYSRYWPDLTTSHTWLAIGLIFAGFIIVYLIDKYGQQANPA
ncbi:DUF368 domain-containing protein, partial [Nonlabens mediterrranea]|nr:DUF368 domain-containing protein [Nonlabens mediterrranea]